MHIESASLVEGSAVTSSPAAPAKAPRGAIGRALLHLCPFPVFLGGLLVAAAFLATRKPAFDPDVWWHAVIGQQILRTGHWPTQDAFSFTAAGAHWIAYEWFGELWMGIAYRWGERGLVVLNGLWASLLLVLLYAYLTVRTKNCKAAFAATAVAIPVLSGVFSARPQMLGYGFLLVELLCLERYAQGSRRALWVLPPLYLVWVNTHGSFLLGLAIWGAFWLAGLFRFRHGELLAEPWTRQQRRELLFALLGAVAVLPLTPYGTRLAAYPLEMAVLQRVNLSHIQEWLPIAHFTEWWSVFLACLLTLFLVQLLWRPPYRLFDALFLFAAAAATAVHIRFVFVFMFPVAVRLALVVARWFAPYQVEKDRPGLNVLLLAVFGGLLVWTFPSRAQLDQDLSKSYPLQAVQHFRADWPPAPVLNEYGWGGYLIGKYRGKVKVFIDGRADLYEYAGVLQDYIDLMDLKADAPLILAKYHVRSAFIRTDCPLTTYLSAAPGWRKVYQDKLATIFVFEAEGLPGVSPSSHPTVLRR